MYTKTHQRCVCVCVCVVCVVCVVCSSLSPKAGFALKSIQNTHKWNPPQKGDVIPPTIKEPQQEFLKALGPVLW